MGIDYRCVNGYIYISGNPVTDPAKIAERAEFFQRRAGYYYENWAELYGKWQREDGGADRRARRRCGCPTCPSTSPTRSPSRRPQHRVLRGARRVRTRRCGSGDLMWQHHFEFLLLGYGAYATFAEFCKAHLPDIPDQHIAQMVAGIDVLLFRPDAELRRLARLAIETGVDGAFAQDRRPPEIDAELAQSEAGRAGWRSSRRSRTRGSTWRPATASPLLPQLARRPEHPLRVADRPHRGAARRGAGRAADRGDRSASATGSPRSTGRCSTRSSRARSTICWRSRARCSPTSRSTSSSATTGS